MEITLRDLAWLLVANDNLKLAGRDVLHDVVHKDIKKRGPTAYNLKTLEVVRDFLRDVRDMFAALGDTSEDYPPIIVSEINGKLQAIGEFIGEPEPEYEWPVDYDEDEGDDE